MEPHVTEKSATSPPLEGCPEGGVGLDLRGFQNLGGLEARHNPGFLPPIHGEGLPDLKNSRGVP
jgi:hypothetical protein